MSSQRSTMDQLYSLLTEITPLVPWDKQTLWEDRRWDFNTIISALEIRASPPSKWNIFLDFHASLYQRHSPWLPLTIPSMPPWKTQPGPCFRRWWTAWEPKVQKQKLNLPFETRKIDLPGIWVNIREGLTNRQFQLQRAGELDSTHASPRKIMESQRSWGKSTQGGFSGSQEFWEIKRSLKQVSHEYLGSEM